MRRVLAAGLGLGAVNALLALLSGHLIRKSEQGGLGWFGSTSQMPRRYADYLPGTAAHPSAWLVLAVVLAFLVMNSALLGVGYRVSRRPRH